MTTSQAVILKQGASVYNNNKIVPGRKAQVKITAACNNAPAKVTVVAYNLPAGVYGPLIDRNGYRPQPDAAVAPTYISGPYQNTGNPLEFFDIGSPDGSRVIAVTCQATKEPCGQWNGNGTVSFSALPLTYDPFDFFANTTLKRFAISEHLYFGFGTKWEPGFMFEQKTEFFQFGYFGVIQLIRGVYKYQLENSSDWHNIENIAEYVLDTPDDLKDPVNQRIKVAPGIQKVQFRDAPGLDLEDLIKVQPKVSSVQIDVQLKTYFMFNPSDAKDPNADLQTTWYPISVGIEWECGAKIDYTEGLPKKVSKNWKFSANYAELKRSTANDFPVWTGRMHGGNPRDTGARNLNVVTA